MTNRSGFWAMENWFPRIPRWVFFGLTTPIVLGLLLLQGSRFYGSGDGAIEKFGTTLPVSIQLPAYFAVCILALGRARDVGRELSFMRFLRTRGVVRENKDAMIVSGFFALGSCFLLPISLQGFLVRLECSEGPALMCAVWPFIGGAINLILFFLLPLKFLASPTLPTPLQQNQREAPK